MKNLCILFCFSLLVIFGCSKDKDVIEIVRNSTMINGLEKPPTAQFLQSIIEDGAKKGVEYEWVIQKTDSSNIYIASFQQKKESTGYRWEVDLKNKVARYINSNKFLSLKYGFSRLNYDGSYNVIIEQDSLKNKFVRDFWSNKYRNEGIIYYAIGSIKNNSGKTLIKSDLTATLYLIFGVDKWFEYNSTFRSGFVRNISTNKPWLHDSSVKFYLETEAMPDIYKNYEPIYALCEFNLTTEDPIGYEFNWVVKIVDLKDKFSALKNK